MRGFVRLIVLIIVFVLFLAAISASIIMISAGILAIPLSIGVMSGFFTSVASDISPPAMLFAGIACLSGGLALGVVIIMLFPKQPFILRKFADKEV
ncbi:MAG: hypothetical protein FWG45_01570 [Oscillospiraceae bacterium]|nr:hypothetical protein [Oscillospiraceae bacterium]